MEKKKVFNLIILDESGSMESIKSETISGFNEVVQTIKAAEEKFPEQEHYVSLVTFNSGSIRTKLDRERVKNLIPLDENNFQPDQTTPLFDAMGMSIVKLRNAIKTHENTAVLVTIITDGMENASMEYSNTQLKQIVEDQKRKGWTFAYIGANHDVEAMADRLGVTNHMSFASNPEDTKKMFVKERKARMSFYESRNLGSSQPEYFKEEIKDKKQDQDSEAFFKY